MTVAGLGGGGAVAGDFERLFGVVFVGSDVPPIKSVTSLFTSSLSLDSGSDDLLGLDP